MLRFIKLVIILAVLSYIAGFVIFLYAAKNISNSYDYIEHSIVLTGGKNRVQTGVAVLDEGLSDMLFISGVNTEVDKQSVLSADFGNHEDDVELGYKATTTKENAIESREWIEARDIKKVRVITSDYHVFRSRLEFDCVMPNIDKDFYSVENINDGFLSSVYNWKILFEEYNKLIFIFVSQEVGRVCK